MATPVLPDLTAALRLVAHETVGPAFRPPWATTRHRASGHELGKHHRFMPLARRQHQRQELTGACGPEVDFRAEASLAAPERFDFGTPFWAPAAC
jgi:hypothetical protein